MNSSKDYIAHISKTGEIQTIKEHSENVASLCREFSIDELKDVCYEIGLHHDIGKYQDGFQRRIRGENIRIEHSICGAKDVTKKYGLDNLIGVLEAICIAGHHSGLPNFGSRDDSKEASSLYGRLKRDAEPYNVDTITFDLPKLDQTALKHLILSHCDKNNKEEMLECFAFLTRYCFSCLVDADTLDTMKANGTPAPAPLAADFQKCSELLEQKFSSFVPQTALQKARGRLQGQAFSNIGADADIYALGMPLGSGKTLTSLKCALVRAKKTGKKRIIYIIPYNSIIDQTVREFEKIFGASAQILRHQSSFSYEDRDDIDEDYRLSALYSSENWDAEIIVTTSVQFFESVYASKRSKTRKIHNMADSILVFDEAHLMPIKYLQACLRSVAFITKYLNSEAIFMTATMPDFNDLIRQYALKDVKMLDLVPDKTDFRYFKKNRYINLDEITDEHLLMKASSYASSLIVVNSRKTAQQLFRSCSCSHKYHLSTYMSSEDRLRVIDEVKARLDYLKKTYPEGMKVPDEEKIILISTSLIEAGVDLDFDAAFRELNGLYSILQTGGRCNREGLHEIGYVFVFELPGSRKKLFPEQSLTKGIISEYEDISSAEAVTEYYKRLLKASSEEITENSLAKQCSSLSFFVIPFRDYSVKLIDSSTVSVVIPSDKHCEDLISKARCTGYAETRKLQKYCCSVYENELAELLKQHAVQEVAGIYVLENKDYYDPDTGIRFEGRDILV